MEKALSYCFECSKYPCELIKNLEKSYNKRYQASLIENGRFAQKHGLVPFHGTIERKIFFKICINYAALQYKYRNLLEDAFVQSD